MAIAKLVHVARELLSKSERSGVLGVGATNLDDVVEFSALSVKNFNQACEFGQETLIDLKDGSDMHD